MASKNDSDTSGEHITLIESSNDENTVITLTDEGSINAAAENGSAAVGAEDVKKEAAPPPGEGSVGDQQGNEDSYLTEEDIFQMKNLTAEREGTTSEAMRSVISLADTTSNFDERVANEDVEGSEVTDMDISVIDEKEALQAAGEAEDAYSDSEEVSVEQGRMSGGFMFDRRRPSNPELPSTVTRLLYPFAKRSSVDTERQSETVDALAGANVYLLGTAHFSPESQKDVIKTIQKAQPDLVMVELCPSRISILSLDEETLLREAKSLNFDKIMSLMKQSGVVQGILHVLLLSMSAHITRELGMAPGGEFRAAYDGAMKVPQCRVVLGDRPIHITLQRALGSLGFFQRLRLFYHLVISHRSSITLDEVERCKNSDMLESLLKEMAGEFPLLSKIFVDERDMYMVNTLHTILRSTTMEKLEACRAINGKFQPVSVVAVVGIGHVPGIVANWEKRISVNELLIIPKPSRVSKVIKFGIKTAVAGVVLYTAYRVGVKVVDRIKLHFN